MTYSILGRDPATGEVGGAVQSAWYGAGSAVIASAGLGAVVAQAFGGRELSDRGLELLAAGSTPNDIVTALVADDRTSSVYQIGVIDLHSTPAAFTGTDCVPHAEDIAGADCVAQANMMRNPGVPDAMVAAFEETSGDLTDRLLAALDAAQGRGGDFRGMQAAGLVVRNGERGRPSWASSVIDVRVDDHSEPLVELRRLVDRSRIFRECNTPLKRLAEGDLGRAIESARDLCSRLDGDGNARMRLGLVLAAAGDPEGDAILAALAADSSQWLAYVRGLCLRYGIDPDPILSRVR